MKKLKASSDIKQIKSTKRIQFWMSPKAAEMIGDEEISDEKYTLHLFPAGSILPKEKTEGRRTVSPEIFFNQVIEENYRPCRISDIYSAIKFKNELHPGENVCLGMIATNSRFDRKLGRNVQFERRKRILVLKKSIKGLLIIKVSELSERVSLKRRFIVRSW